MQGVMIEKKVTESFKVMVMAVYKFKMIFRKVIEKAEKDLGETNTSRFRLVIEHEARLFVFLENLGHIGSHYFESL